MKEKATKFWNWFNANKAKYEKAVSSIGEINQNKLDELMDEFETNLHKFDEEIWFRMGGKNPYELLITAEGQVEKFDDVIALVDLAPKIDNWNIIAFIQPQDITQFKYNMGDFELNQDDVFFSYEEDLSGENGYYLETMFYVNDDKFIDDDEFRSSIIRIAETSLGEYDFAKIVGFIGVEQCSDKYEEHNSGLLPIYSLPKVVENLKSKIKNHQ